MPDPRRRTRLSHNGRVTVRREVAKSAALSLLAMVVVSVGAVWVARAVATHEAEHQAELATEMLAAAIITPALTDGLLDGQRRAIETLDAAVQGNVISEQILTVRVWGPQGNLLYSDDLAAIGTQFPLSADAQQVLATGQGHAHLSDLAKAENADQADFESLLEVYTRVSTPSGQPLLFETYQSTEGLDAATRRIITSFAPVILGGLAVLGLVQLALNWRLARNLQSAQQERERLLTHALEASMHERASIAADLHDGVVQDLVGLTYTLEAMSQGAQDSDAGRAADLSEGLGIAATTTRRSVRSLRSLLVEIYPPNLDQVGLAAALADLAAATRSAGLEVQLQVDPDVQGPGALPPATTAAVYRVVREAISNARRHSGANLVTIRVSGGERATITVADDGVGFDPDAPREGHFGLRLMSDVAASVGAQLTVQSAPGSGTVVTMVVGP